MMYKLPFENTMIVHITVQHQNIILDKPYDHIFLLKVNHSVQLFPMFFVHVIIFTVQQKTPSTLGSEIHLRLMTGF